MHFLKIVYLAIAVCAGAAPLCGANLLTNGDFETGDFIGWNWEPTQFSIGLFPSVVPFDTSGSGSSLAFRVNPGVDSAHCCDIQDEGGRLSQSVSLLGGIPSQIAVGAAAVNNNDPGPNVDGGRIRLSVGGILLWDWDVDRIVGHDTVRNNFVGLYTPPTNGNYTVEFLFTRRYQNLPGLVNHFLDNVSITQVPEPAAVFLVAIGAAALGATHRKSIHR